MKTLKLLSLIFALTCVVPTPASGATVMTNDKQAIVAIGSLPIGGTLYDVCFDGSFGTSMFMGNKGGAMAARDSVTGLINSFFYSIHFPWPFPTLANQSGGGINGTGTYYEVTFNVLPSDDPINPNLREYYFSQYSAGWVSPDSFSRVGTEVTFPAAIPAGSQIEATFRLAIPDSIPNTIPEPAMFTLAFSGLAMLMGRRNRSQNQNIEVD